MLRITVLSAAFLFGCCFSFSGMAQERTKDQLPEYNFSAAYEFLRSTHSDFFNGPSFKIDRNLPGHFKPGIGIGYAATDLHRDNGLILYRMKLLPIYGNVTYDFYSKSKFEPFAEVSAGISFVHYDQATDEDLVTTVRVKEEGLYLYGGFGLRYKASKHLSPYLAAGFKGYHNSFNDLDINPHGVTFQGGIRF